ncbi:MAG: TraM recognition domain-containing protein [Actinobacteria bacterium]|nr:TraM recognition domain-containing protein [Actinomycetota bacterium]
MRRLRPFEVGWRLGEAREPRGGELWVPWDRTAGVVGPQGSGKTLDLLAPALIDAPGAALTTLTKVDDLLLTFTARSRDDRPCVVLDPFGLVPGLPEVVWDPIRGCVDPLVAERRAKAFTAGTVKGAVAGGHADDAARFYAAEAAKVLQGYFHAAALTGRSLEHVLSWVAKPLAASDPTEILREHPHAASFWDGLLYGSLHGDDRTAGNTITTVQQAMSLFFQEDIRRRCVPGHGRPATDITDVIARGGTIYLLGREDPYSSASPLMTAFAEHALDTALEAANTSPWGRLCPPFHAVLDELPSTAPLPTLRTRMANERALGISFIWAAQAWPQLAAIFGEQEARTLVGLTNNLIVFGGSKDVAFNQEISDLLGQVRVSRVGYQTGQMSGRQLSADDIDLSEWLEGGKSSRLSLTAKGSAPNLALEQLTADLDAKATWKTPEGATLGQAEVEFTAKAGQAQVKTLAVKVPGALPCSRASVSSCT